MGNRSFDELSDKERQDLAEMSEMADLMHGRGDVEAAKALRRARLKLAREMMFPGPTLIDEIETELND